MPLLILSAIAVIGAVVVWRSRVSRKVAAQPSPRNEPSVGNCMESANAVREARPPEHDSRSAPLMHELIATASLPATGKAVVRFEDGNTWQNTVLGEWVEFATPHGPAPVDTPQPSAASKNPPAAMASAVTVHEDRQRKATDLPADAVERAGPAAPALDAVLATVESEHRETEGATITASLIATTVSAGDAKIASINRAAAPTATLDVERHNTSSLNTTSGRQISSETASPADKEIAAVLHAIAPFPDLQDEAKAVMGAPPLHAATRRADTSTEAIDCSRAGAGSLYEAAAGTPAQSEDVERVTNASSAALQRYEVANADEVVAALPSTQADSPSTEISAPLEFVDVSEHIASAAEPSGLELTETTGPSEVEYPSGTTGSVDRGTVHSAMPAALFHAQSKEASSDHAVPVGAAAAHAAVDPPATQETSAAGTEPENRYPPDAQAIVDEEPARALPSNALDSPRAEADGAAESQPLPAAEDTAGVAPLPELKLDDLEELLRDAKSHAARQAMHRDRRGRQPLSPQLSASRQRAKQQRVLRPASAEARLRLTLHPIRRTVGLSLILMRPAEYPERVTLELNGVQTVDALEEGQYGDVDLAWDKDLLLNEVRVSCAEGYQWVRSARPVHIFAADPAQADLVSVSAATAGADHTLICREQDVGAVCEIAESAGSARPAPFRRYSGLPDGWVVLSGYRPTRAAALRPTPALSPLDPGHRIEISLHGGLEVGRRLYAQGRPPRVRIKPLLDGVSVRIGGAAAIVSADGGWEAPGWDAPGTHRVEVVPGPSLTYEIKADPAIQGGWKFWDAYADRAPNNAGPWSQAQICGARLSSPTGGRVIATELRPMVLALGVDGTVGVLRPREGAGVSVGFATGTPAFLVVSSGRRRRQGKIVWLGLVHSAEVTAQGRRLSPVWIEAVRSAAARRLAMQADDEGVGHSLWQKAVILARSAKRRRFG